MSDSLPVLPELRKRTLIILDWDDTMMNTSRLTERYMVFGPGALKPLPASLRSDLAALETDAIQMLDMFRSRGCAPLLFLFWPIALPTAPIAPTLRPRPFRLAYHAVCVPSIAA